MAPRNHYVILGIHSECTKDDVKKAYRSLAKKYHPDKHKGNIKFANLFIEITAAYNILSDEQLRKEYDKSMDHESGKFQKNESSTSQNNSDYNQQERKSIIPEIVTFSSNKISFTTGENISFYWEVINAYKVEIQPYGVVNSKGSKTIKVNNPHKRNLVLKLIATNITGQFVTKTIEIPIQNINKSDKGRSARAGFGDNNGVNLSDPEIEYFNTNKNAFVVGETINFFWKTKNADFIEIKPFGVVTAIGIRGFEMNDDVSTLVVNLIAKNTLTGKIISKTLEIPNVKNKITDENRTNNKPSIKLNFSNISFALILLSQLIPGLAGLYGAYWFRNFADPFLFWLCLIFGSVFTISSTSCLIGNVRKK